MIPPIYTEAWQQWLDSQINERIAYCDVVRDRIYFAPNGNDITGDGTSATPYKSLVKAQSILDLSNGHIELHFADGEYNDHTRLDTSKSFVKITSPNRAIFNSFRVITDPLLPVQDYSEVFVMENAENIVWVKEHQSLDPYVRLNFVANVQVIDGSFYYDGNEHKLYINPKGDVDPNTNGIVYEYNQPADACFVLRGDGGVIENITTIGYGMQFTVPSQQHGIDVRTTFGKETIVSNCESYYGSSHAMVTAAGGTVGGKTTFINCKAGYVMYNGSAGETVFNTYAFLGSQNTFFINCEVVYGTLPSSDWYWENEKRGRGFFGHTGGGTNVEDLIVMYNCRSSNCGNPSSFNDLPPAETLEDVRCFIVKETFGGPGNGLAVFSSDTVRYQCKYSVTPVTEGALANWHQNGWFINSALDVSLERLNNKFALYNGLPGNISTPHAYNSLFYIRNNTHQNQVWLDYDGNQTQDGIIANSIIHTSRFNSFNFGTNINYVDNAYSNITNGGELQINYGEWGRPPCNSLLNGFNLQLPIENDIDGRVIVRKSIGPWETWGCADFNKNGVIDFFDFLDFMVCFDNLDMKSDLSGDNQIDFFDYLDFTNWLDRGHPQ